MTVTFTTMNMIGAGGHPRGGAINLDHTQGVCFFKTQGGSAVTKSESESERERIGACHGRAFKHEKRGSLFAMADVLQRIPHKKRYGSVAEE